MSIYLYNEMTKLLIVFIVFCCMSHMNSLTIKIYGNPNDIHEKTFKKPGHYVEPSEYNMNIMRSMNDKLYRRKVISKRDAGNDKYMGLIKVNNAEDPFDFVFPKDDIYGYQPEVINYQVEYITTDDNLVKVQIKTSFGDGDLENVMINNSDVTTTEKSRDTLEADFGNKLLTKTTTTEITTQLNKLDELNEVNSTESSIEANSSTTKKVTVLDASNGFGLQNINKIADIENNTIITVKNFKNKTKKSLLDYYTLLWSSFCEMRCFKMVLNYYSPVCGSDGNSYWNDQKLSCVNECGRNVTQVYNARCRGYNVKIIV